METMDKKFTQDELQILDRIFTDKSPIQPTCDDSIEMQDRENEALLIEQQTKASQAILRKRLRITGMVLTVITVLISIAYLIAGHTTLGLLFMVAFAAGHLMQLKKDEADHESV